MLRLALLYTALFIGANPAFAGKVDWQAAREAGLERLLPTENAPAVGETPFTDRDGRESRLSDYRGKVLLVNFWATWCPPCRKEMPSLDALQAEMGGEDFEVLTIATGRDTVSKIDAFFDQTGVRNLPVLLDPKQRLAREMGVVGLPVSVLVDREGREVARLMGDADWSGDAAKQVIRELTSE